MMITDGPWRLINGFSPMQVMKCKHWNEFDLSKPKMREFFEVPRLLV